MNLNIDYLKKKTSELTHSPGVYLMKNFSGKIIYVGKAKDLHNRVSSYFFQNDHLPKVERMIEDVYNYDFIVTTSEYEALILECDFIKEYRPQYNILLMDDKAYTYLRIGNSDYSRLKSTKSRKVKGTYFGPYISGSFARLLLIQANDIFKLPTCNRDLTRKYPRTCLRYHMGKCLGYCIKDIGVREYNKSLNDVKLFLKGGYGKCLENLQDEMKQAAKNLNFEKAIYLRDRLKAIDTIQNKQIVINNYYKNCDVWASYKSGGETCVSVLIYRNGSMTDRGIYFAGLTMSPDETQEYIMVQHYTNYRNLPDKIIFEYTEVNPKLIEHYIKEKYDVKVACLEPSSGLAKDLFDLSEKNAREHTEVRQKTEKKSAEILDTLYRQFNLPRVPEYIESYDISNYGESSIIAGMVVYEHASPKKEAYRHFNFDTNKQDDYRCMYMTLLRRLKHVGNDNNDKYFNRKPDLLLIDGGLNHLKFVNQAMGETGVFVPMLGMVKDDNHITRALINLEGKEFAIKDNLELYNFFAGIQEEVHRFSISYMKQYHKRLFKSSLLNVNGIGEVRLKKLFDKYKNLEALKKADKAELKEYLKISDAVADELYESILKL